jgi:hypothetical protein
VKKAHIRRDESVGESRRVGIGHLRGKLRERGVPRIQYGSGGRRFGAIAHDAGFLMQ